MTAMAVQLQTLLQHWLDAMARASWQGAIAIAAAFVLCRAFRRIPPAIQSWIWRLAILKLLLALIVLPSIPIPVLRPNRSVTSIETASFTPATIEAIEADLLPSETFAPAATPSPAAAPRPATPTLTLPSFLFPLWLLGLFAFVLHLLRDALRFAQLRRHARRVTDPLVLSLYADVCGHDTHVPLLCSSSHIPVPLLTGLLRPVVLLPESSLSSTPRHQLRLLLAHELAHHRRRDLLWNWLFALAQALFFFHPLIHLARREWAFAQEAAADEEALRSTRADTSDLAQALYDAVAAIAPQRRSLLAVGVVGSQSMLTRRLTAMKHARTLPRPVRIAFVVSLVLLATLTLLPWRAVAVQDAPQPPTPAPPARADAPADPFAPGAAPAADPANASDPFAGPGPRLPNGMVDHDVQWLGTITAPTLEIRSPADQHLVEVLVKEGQAVKTGEALMRADTAQAEVQVMEAKLKFERARSALANIDRMRQVKAVSEFEIQEAKTSLQLAELGVRSAEDQLQSRRIVAPMDGVITELLVSRGQYVLKGAPLGTLVAVNAPRLQFVVHDRLIPHLKVGQKITFTSTSPEFDRPFHAEIDFISPQIDPNSGVVQIKARPDPDQRLRPGMRVTVRLPLDKAP